MRTPMALWFALALACIHQGPPTPSHPEPPDLLSAQAFIWAFYGEASPPPLVEVISGAALTCRNSPCPTLPCTWLGFGAVGVQHGACLAGIEGTSAMVTVARVGAEPWWHTALAHEDLHAHEALHGVVDMEHLGSDWKPGGMLDKVTAALMARTP